MPDLVPLSPDAVPAALEKALRYRLLNEPSEAESICRDVLVVDADNQEALVTLVLALSDQLDRHRAGVIDEARQVIARLDDEYRRAYYTGILAERRGKSIFRRGGPGCGWSAYEWLKDALEHFSTAMELRPVGNEESVLRWNACLRFMELNPSITPAPLEERQAFLE